MCLIWSIPQAPKPSGASRAPLPCLDPEFQPAAAQQSPDTPGDAHYRQPGPGGRRSNRFKGKQVTNLTADDFQIFQDGKPHKITHFSYISHRGSPDVESGAGRRFPRGKRLAPPPGTLRPDQVRRTVALVVDDLGLSFESMAQVRSTLKRFVDDQQMQPGDLVAIIRTGAGMGALQEFTSDKRSSTPPSIA